MNSEDLSCIVCGLVVGLHLCLRVQLTLKLTYGRIIYLSNTSKMLHIMWTLSRYKTQKVHCWTVLR